MTLMSKEVSWTLEDLAALAALVTLMSSTNVCSKHVLLFGTKRAPITEELNATAAMNSLRSWQKQRLIELRRKQKIKLD